MTSNQIVRAVGRINKTTGKIRFYGQELKLTEATDDKWVAGMRRNAHEILIPAIAAAIADLNLIKETIEAQPDYNCS